MINQDLHREGLGGSEVGSVFGVDENRTGHDLWCLKKGLLKPPPPNIRMIVGKLLEPAVLKLYTHITGREVEYCDVTSRHPQRPWMIGTPDGICKDRVVEVKVIAWDQKSAWGDSPYEIPEKHQLQCWHYMAFLDVPRCDLIALVAGEPKIYELTRDQEAEKVMLAREEEWVQRYLVGNEMPPLQHSELAQQWLQQAFPRHKRPDLRPATDPEVGMLREGLQIVLEQRYLARRRAELETALKAAIEDREGLLWPEGKLTWRRTKDREVIDWESVARGLLNQYVDDMALRDTLLGIHTYPKPGTRRIRWDADALREAEEEDQ